MSAIGTTIVSEKEITQYGVPYSKMEKWRVAGKENYLPKLSSFWTVNTRANQTRPCKRWHEGLETASEFLDLHIDLWDLSLTDHAACRS